MWHHVMYNKQQLVRPGTLCPSWHRTISSTLWFSFGDLSSRGVFARLLRGAMAYDREDLEIYGTGVAFWAAGTPLAIVRQIFHTFGKESSDCLSPDQLGDALRLAGTNPTHQEVSALLERLGHPSAFDAAALGQVALDDWLSKDQASELLSSLRLFDPSGSGRITTQELQRIMQMGGYSFSEKDLEEMLQYVNVDSQGTVDYTELVSNYFLAPESGVVGTIQARPRAKSDYPLARFRRAVRKLRMLRMVAFTTHSSSFTAENAVGVVEANLAIDEEFEQVMKRMNRGRTTVIRD
eukprot:s6206_g1.t2